MKKAQKYESSESSLPSENEGSNDFDPLFDLDAFQERLSKAQDRSKAKWAPKNLFSYTWSVIVGLFALFVILSVFSSTFNSAETIVYAILLIIYVYVRTAGATLGQQAVNDKFFNYHHFQQIKKLLGSKETEVEIDDLEKATRAFDVAEVKFYISMIFNSLFFFIALYNLLTTI